MSMKTSISLSRPLLRFLMIIVGLGLACRPISAQTLTQTFNLVPGWNSIYLEVDLPDTRMGDVFTNLPIAGVWTWSSRVSSVDFIQDPSQPLMQSDHWLVYYPPSLPESRFNSLFQMKGRRPYLIKLTGAQPVTLTLAGGVSIRQQPWTANAFNFRGFPVDPDYLPTFQNFFQYSAAHYNPATQTLQPIYRLNPAGHWDLVKPGDMMKRGEAYWVYTQGTSDFNGRFRALLSNGKVVQNRDGLDFGADAAELTLQIQNRSGVAIPLVIDNTAGAQPPLSFYVFPSAGPSINWGNLGIPAEFFVPAGQPLNIRLAIRRTAFAGTNYTTLLALRDRAGTLVYVPVNADKPNSGSTPPQPLSAKGPGKNGVRRASDVVASPFAGLWVGNIVLNGVSEPNGGQLVTNIDLATGTNQVIRTNISPVPTPATNTFTMRLLVHVDSSGQARLLKEITLLSSPALYTNDASGNSTLSTPAQAVLLTDPTLFGQYSGAKLLGGQFVGRRLSTIHFDFSGALQLDMQGSFGISSNTAGIETVTIPIGAAQPTNPFLHQYHPDHRAAQSYTITRAIEFDFTLSDPAHPSDPGWGSDQAGGIYQETLTGLHREPIRLAGYFKLQRISTVGQLNPVPGSL